MVLDGHRKPVPMHDSKNLAPEKLLFYIFGREPRL